RFLITMLSTLGTPSKCFIFLLICTVLPDDATVVTNPGYPEPYRKSLEKYRFTETADSSQGVAVFFNQFLANQGDCVTVCDVEAVCQSLCGDAMDHVKMKKALIVNSTATITMQSISKPDGYFHTGISMETVLFDLTRRTYFQCNSTVDLQDGTPFFLVSQNYPYSPFDYSYCNVTFTSGDAIRAAIYDLVTVETVVFEGTDLSGEVIRVPLSGRHVTDDEPVALYFTKSLTVSFSFSSTSTYYTRGFYILVESYIQGPSSPESCLNSGDFEVVSKNPIDFGTKKYGIDAYSPNIKCWYSFRNTFKDHLIAVYMEFETEKCCDIMLIDGIAPAPYNLYNYQGFMQPMFQFANSSTVTFNFTSDGLVGGAGFSGSVYNIDCFCNYTLLQLTEENPYKEIASPGFLDGAPTYCPNLNCLWIVQFSTDYELVSNMSVLNLRSVDTPQDLLTVTDNFGRILIQKNVMSYGDVSEAITTSGQLSFNLVTSPVTAFSPSLMASGFLVQLTLVKKNFQRKTIVLTDEKFMVDISTEFFAKGLNMTYEYLITARPNRKVAVYFFTATYGTVNLDVYDGPDASADSIYTSWLYDKIDGTAPSIMSTGQHMLIRVRPNLYNTKSELDFQAMVTDLQPDNQCLQLVYTAATTGQQVTIQLTGSNCIHVYHATGDYEPSNGITVDLGSTSQVTLYKGLTTNVTNIIKSAYSMEYPKFIYGSYVVTLYNSSVSGAVKYSWAKGTFTTTLTMSPIDTGIIISEDYLPEYPISAFEQQFSIELIGDSTHMTGIRIEFLKPLGQGHGTLQMQQYNKLLKEIPYPAADGTTTFEQCGTKMIISYVSPGGSSNGLYARYSRGSQSCNHGPSVARISSVFMSILLGSLLGCT
uniref:CUB domain-containing protein n=1 Tax=Haemonchus contortus TaxID=6289 RepID=A0A7I4Z029_HAECO